MRKVSLNHENVKVKENKLEEKVNNLLLHKKYLYYKRLKENAKKFCDRVRNLDFDCESYEEIDNSNSKINLGKQNLINVGNLERIIKLKCIKRNKSAEYEDNLKRTNRMKNNLIKLSGENTNLQKMSIVY